MHKIKQKVICEVGARAFKRELQEHLDDGWRVVPATLTRGDGDNLLCVIEVSIPERMPCFEEQDKQ
jgi:hypothetical protein